VKARVLGHFENSVSRAALYLQLIFAYPCFSSRSWRRETLFNQEEISRKAAKTAKEEEKEIQNDPLARRGID